MHINNHNTNENEAGSETGAETTNEKGADIAVRLKILPLVEKRFSEGKSMRHTRIRFF